MRTGTNELRVADVELDVHGHNPRLLRTATVAAGLSRFATSFAVDFAGGRVFWFDPASRSVLVAPFERAVANPNNADPAAARQQSSSGSNQARVLYKCTSKCFVKSLEWDARRQRLYLAEWDSNALWFLDASNNRTVALNVTQPKAVAVGAEGELVVSFTGTQLQNVVELIGSEVTINSARKPTRRLILLRKLPFRITDAVTLSCGHQHRHLRSQSQSRSFEAPQPLGTEQQKRHAAHVRSCFLLADLFSGFAALCDPSDPRNICHTIVHNEFLPTSFAVSGIATGVSVNNAAAEASEGAAKVPHGLRLWGDKHLLVAEGSEVRVCRPSFCQQQSDRRPLIDFEGANGILYMRAFLLPATYSYS